MICPRCDTRMLCIRSRPDNDGQVRMQECPKCKLHIFTEEVEISKEEFYQRVYQTIKKRYIKRNGY